MGVLKNNMYFKHLVTKRLLKRYVITNYVTYWTILIYLDLFASGTFNT